MSILKNPTNNNPDNIIPLVFWLILILFFIKCSILAFSIIPLWDIHDEPGHYSYIQDIAMGKGLPIMGETPIAQNIMDNWFPDKPGLISLNWIAQHPPLYHILGAGLLFTVNLLTQDPYWLFHVPRLLSTLFATGNLLVIFLFIRDYTKDEIFAITCSAIVGFIPMYSNMASGTNHDMALVFFSSLSFLFLYRFYSLGLNKYAYLSVFFIGAACTTKFSAFLLALPILVIIFIVLEGDWFIKFRNIILLCFTASILPSLFLIRNFFLFGTPFITFTDLGVVKVKSIGFIEYLQINPVVEELFKNFFGAIGWTGVGRGDLLWFQINGIYLLIIFLVLLIVSSFSFLWYLKERFHAGSEMDFLLIIFAILTFGTILLSIFISKNYMFVQKILFTIILTIPFLSVFMIRKQEKKDLFLYLSLFIILFYYITFTSLFLITLYEQYGWARALHGRYFFPLIPLLIISYLYPAYRLFKPRQWIMVLIVALAALFEFSFFFQEVIPFFNQVIL